MNEFSNFYFTFILATKIQKANIADWKILHICIFDIIIKPDNQQIAKSECIQHYT